MSHTCSIGFKSGNKLGDVLLIFVFLDDASTVRYCNVIRVAGAVAYQAGLGLDLNFYPFFSKREANHNSSRDDAIGIKIASGSILNKCICKHLKENVFIGFGSQFYQIRSCISHTT